MGGLLGPIMVIPLRRQQKKEKEVAPLARRNRRGRGGRHAPVRVRSRAGTTPPAFSRNGGSRGGAARPTGLRKARRKPGPPCRDNRSPRTRGPRAGSPPRADRALPLAVRSRIPTETSRRFFHRGLRAAT